MNHIRERIQSKSIDDRATDRNIKNIIQTSSALGFWIAITIISFWMLSLILFLLPQWTQISEIWLIVAVLVRTFFQTGLFILAHDAMHGSLRCNNKPMNDQLGKIALWLYACLSYDRCYTNHLKHHRYLTQRLDPDFHHGIHADPIRWYLRFLGQYLTARQMLCLLSWWGLIFIGLHQGFGTSPIQFFLLWIVPLILSSMQLFYFGTYLPHRGPKAEGLHEIHSSPYPVWLSFLTCYHFGYHWEHHQFPQIPWYQLPRIHAWFRSQLSVNHF